MTRAVVADRGRNTSSGEHAISARADSAETASGKDRRARLWFPAAASVILIAGCSALGPTYVYVDSIAARDVDGLTDYYLLSELRRQSRVAGREIGSAYARKRDEKFMALMDTALQSAGFSPVNSPDQAQLVILLNYGVDVASGRLKSDRTSAVQIAAFDWAAVKDLDQRNAIWRTSAWMEGSSGGLGRVVPMLIEAVEPYLGKNTRGTVEVAVQ